MVHFDFVVEDVDAENIMYCIRDAAAAMDSQIIDRMAIQGVDPKNDSYINAYRSHKEYLLSLMKMMTNTRVETTNDK